MKKIILLSFIFCSIYLGYAQEKIIGSKEKATVTRELASFTAVYCDMIADLQIIQSPESKIMITASENIIEYVNSKISAGRLSLSLKDSLNYSNCGCNIKIYTPHLNDINLKSNCTTTSISGFTEEDLSIKLCGDLNLSDITITNNLAITTIGKIKIKDFSAKNITMDIKGISKNYISKQKKSSLIENLSINIRGAVSLNMLDLNADKIFINSETYRDVQLAGRANELTLRNRGREPFNAKDLKTRIAYIDNTGYGEVKLTVTDTAIVSPTTEDLGDGLTIGWNDKIKIYGGGRVIKKN